VEGGLLQVLIILYLLGAIIDQASRVADKAVMAYRTFRRLSSSKAPGTTWG